MNDPRVVQALNRQAMAMEELTEAIKNLAEAILKSSGRT